VQVDVNFFVKVKLFDFLTGLGSHETGQATFLGLEVNESHQGLVFGVLGVADLAVLDLTEDRKSFLQFLLCDGVF
jgi:hypothetical protein